MVNNGGNKQLRSNTGRLSSSMSYYLSIQSEAIYEAKWEFFVNLKFGTSGSNYVDFFLTSDVSNLSSVQNGYFIRIGDTEDRIALFKIVDGVSTEDHTPLITTSNRFVNSSSNNFFAIRVTRDSVGNWDLLIEDNTLDTYLSVGTVFDNEIQFSKFFGFLIKQSTASSPVNNHFFDDFRVVGSAYPDTVPPIVESIAILSDTVISIRFSEEINELIAENLSYYALSEGIDILNSDRDALDYSIIYLTTSPLSNGQNYTLTINGLEDLEGNSIIPNSTSNFQYILVEMAEKGDIVINEFLVNTDGPNDDFVEIYNRSDKYIDLKGWTIEDGGSTGGATDSFPSKILNPEHFLILFKNNSRVDYSSFGNFLEVNSSDFTFNNSNDTITLKDSKGEKIDCIGYGIDLPPEGVSLELVNPDNLCFSIYN